MFYNGANCDIYIGKGAGKKLMNDIEFAKDSIKVVSPYLSPSLIKQLIRLNKRNVQIQLITTDTIEDFYGSYEKNNQQLIIQNIDVDKVAVSKREQWSNVSSILLYIIIGLVPMLIGFFLFTQEEKVILGVIPIIVLLLIRNIYNMKIRKKRIYSYWYSQLFPFKVFKSQKTTNQHSTFIHGKIYVIDNKTAYLGSLNFTESGTKYNYETRVRTIDPRAINEILKEIQALFDNPMIPQKDIQLWGKELYQEPIN